MLLQTNSYIVPKDKRSEHARLLRKFRQTLNRLGCDQFEAYEQVGANWSTGEATGRFVQIMRFRDRKHQQQVQAGEKSDPAAQQLIQEFCALINFPYQQQQGLFAVGFYASAMPVVPPRAANKILEITHAELPATIATVENALGDTPDVAEPTASPSEILSEDFELPLSPVPEGDGASMLDFSALAPDEDERPPLRLTSDADEVIESEIASLDDSSMPASTTPVLGSDNGEHAGSFADTDETLEIDSPPETPAKRDRRIS